MRRCPSPTRCRRSSPSRSMASCATMAADPGNGMPTADKVSLATIVFSVPLRLASPRRERRGAII
ncbi:hypothetical protein BOS5A_200564 [Bosea sp. EC-HK365B]|nr:hypothetical protein BOSE21B_110512 [Bosea sp. 21B]CAD5279540.1 hypothetical protein BOSE7B_40703 [Bosea sp. 7B]VVT58395.1 hypothetical protein BOS5A_200564 [Bosea sp. EC-HK365B]VXC83128.1 hypothetical protein BOSE127_60101 [Bosea sp. 127]